MVRVRTPETVSAQVRVGAAGRLALAMGWGLSAKQPGPYLGWDRRRLAAEVCSILSLWHAIDGILRVGDLCGSHSDRPSTTQAALQSEPHRADDSGEYALLLHCDRPADALSCESPRHALLPTQLHSRIGALNHRRGPSALARCLSPRMLE